LKKKLLSTLRSLIITNEDLQAIVDSKMLQKSLTIFSFYKNENIFDFKDISKLKRLKILTILFDSANRENCKNILFLINNLPVIKLINPTFKNIYVNPNEYKLFLALEQRSKNNSFSNGVQVCLKNKTLMFQKFI